MKHNKMLETCIPCDRIHRDKKNICKKDVYLQVRVNCRAFINGEIYFSQYKIKEKALIKKYGMELVDKAEKDYLRRYV